MRTGPDPRPGGRGAIFRDSYGVPNLWAETVDDLAYVQGYEAAYERAWQLDLGRWRAEGRSAAVLGEPALEWDVFARRARIADTARRAFDRLDARTRSWCNSYVHGVNDGLAEGAAGSAELAALGVAPGRWQAWSPLAVFAGIHVVFGTCQYKLWREHVAAMIGVEHMGLFGVEGGATGGSNAFAVTGRRSPTGLPLIAGDPHRNLEAPNVYQQVRLACPEFDVVGLAFPGVPGIAHFGHAGTVAWATTNAMADYQDLYVEQLRSSPDVEARGPDGWEPVEQHREWVDVRDAEPVAVEVLETARGPVVLDGIDPYSLRTPSRVELDLGFAALLPLLHARTVADVETAMTHWVEPVNVLVIADSGGRLREQVVGLVPERSPDNRVLPASATDPAAGWAGHYLHPAGHDRQVVVNGNDRASGAGLGYDYAPPERARRIRLLVEEGAAFAPAGLGAVSVDTEQPQAAVMRTLLAGVGEGLSGPARALREQLLGWDGRADADSRDAAVFAAWRWAVVAWLLTQPPLSRLAEGHLPGVFARWLDPTIRVGASWEQLALAADRLALDIPAGVQAALEQVAADPPTRSWGATHRFAPLHPLSGREGGPPIPGPLLSGTALSGDAGCVLATRSHPGLTDACSFGPVARYLWDLADRDRSRWVVPLGTSWRAESPHRLDQLEPWSRGETIPVITEWAALRLDRTLSSRPPGSEEIVR